MELFGARVRRLRDARGWTRPELEKASGVDRQTIYRIEAGQTKGLDLSNFIAVARALAVTLDELVSGTDLDRQPSPTTHLDDDERGRAVLAAARDRRVEPVGSEELVVLAKQARSMAAKDGASRLIEDLVAFLIKRRRELRTGIGRVDREDGAEQQARMETAKAVAADKAGGFVAIAGGAADRKKEPPTEPPTGPRSVSKAKRGRMKASR